MASAARVVEKRRVSLVQVQKAAAPAGTDAARTTDRATELVAQVQRSVQNGLDLDDEFRNLPSHELWSSILAIRAQIVQADVKTSAHVHKNRSAEYARRYRSGESALAIAQHERFPPYLLIKILLPILEPELQKKKKISVDIIKDERLKREFKECEEADQDYAPCMDRIRQAIGDEYEFKLQRELRALGAIFQHEDDLRESGFRKTPDALFSIPLAIDLEKVFATDPWARKHNEPLQRKHHIVRWIDSKAMFGNYETHTKTNREQLQGYVARFGPGMVVYWFGFDYRGESALNEVLLVSKFPVDAIVML